jgi:DNA-binding response OmpR family regulator
LAVDDDKKIRDLHGNKERALKAGAKAFMQKPWNDNELLALIRQLLGQPELLVFRKAWSQ